MATEWEMPRRSDRCQACEAVFAPGGVFHAYLYESGDAYERRDFCLSCQPPESPAPLGFWRARRPAPAERRGPSQPFDRDAVFAFFQRLTEGDTDQRRQFRFVLALLLWRKKVLKLDRTEPAEDGEAWSFTAPHSGESFRVQRPDISDDDATRLSVHVERLLGGGPGPDELDAALPSAEEARA